MKDLRIDSMIEVPVEYLDSNYKDLLKALTVANPEYRNSKFFAKGFGKSTIPPHLHFFEIDEVNRLIYIPRNIDKKLFDINNYNIIYNTINNINTIETTIPQVTSAEPRYYQEEFLDGKVYPYLHSIKNKPFSDILINSGCGSGKCHGKGTKILMFDGSVKNVEDIKVGEFLMGDDSTPRKVLSLARGQEEMFLIKQKKGESYTANKSHILSLQKRIWGVNSPSNRYSKDTRDKYGEVVNISIEEYLKKSKKQKQFLYGYSKGVDYPEQQILIDPYFLGLWLGDGGQHRPIMTTNIEDEVLIDYYQTVANTYGCTITISENKNKSDNYNFVTQRGKVNPLLELLRTENLLFNKHIPNNYLINNREVRLKVLAGLIDTDGSYSNGGYSITQKRFQLIKDVQKLCWSLGYKTKLSEVIKKGKVYYRINITGNTLTEIPVLLERKKAEERVINKDASVTGIEVISTGMGDYYGFTLDGNHLYQLHDGTVTHNTYMALKIAQFYGVKTLVLVTQKKIGEQFLDTCRDLFKGWSCGWEDGKSEYDITVGTYSLLSGDNYSKDYFAKFGHYIYDEYHRCGAVTYMEVLRKSVGRKRTSLSIGGEAIVEIKGDIFNTFVGTFEDAWSIASSKYSIYVEDDYEIIQLPSTILSRGWETNKFVWKPINKIIRHKCDRPSSIIRVGGDKLLLTNDHSIFTIDNNKKISEKRTDELQLKEITLFDNGYENGGDSEIDVITIISENYSMSGIKVGVDLTNLTDKDFKELNITPREKWRFKNSGKYGHYLPMDIFIKIREQLPNPTIVYYEGANGCNISPKIRLSDWAYLIGFFYGDGWFSGKRMELAVEDNLVTHIEKALSELPNVDVAYYTQDTKGKSKQINISNKLFVLVLKHFLGDYKCHQKFINSSCILEWTKDKRLELLKGLIDSDGHFANKDTSKRYYYTTTSKKLAKTIHSLLRSIGVVGSITTTKPAKGGIINGRCIVGKKTKYSINWSHYSMLGNNKGNKGLKNSFEHGDLDFIEAKIKSIEQVEDLPEYVYDFEMKGHPSFVANGILVHNTATPRRKDGLYKILQIHAGEVITMDRSDMQARIFPITTGSDLEEWRYRNVTRNSTKPHNLDPYSEVCLKHATGRNELDRGMVTSIKKETNTFTLMSFKTRTDVSYSFLDVSVHLLGTVSTATMDTDISINGSRNALVLSLVRHLRKSGRKIVLLSKRKDQLFIMERIFKKRGIKCGVVVSDKDITYKEHCKKLGKTTKEYSKWVFEEADVLLGIDKLAEEGMDAPRYDTLIYLHPIKDIEQSIGRVLREKPNKPQPLGIYLIDKVSIYHNSFYGQKGAKKEFERLGHEVEQELSLMNFEQIKI